MLSLSLSLSLSSPEAMGSTGVDVGGDWDPRVRSRRALSIIALLRAVAANIGVPADLLIAGMSADAKNKLQHKRLRHPGLGLHGSTDATERLILICQGRYFSRLRVLSNTEQDFCRALSSNLITITTICRVNAVAAERYGGKA